MENTTTLEKTTRIIGKTTKTIFSVLWYLILILSFVMNYADVNGNSPDIATIIGRVLGILLFGYIGNLILRILLKPSIEFGDVKNQYLENELNVINYKKKWNRNLLFSIIFSVLFLIPTFGISIILMIPNFILLSKSKI